MLATSWMNPKMKGSKSSRAPKISDKEIELLLKKGILGLLDNDENGEKEAHTMDIDELIKNSKTTNYSMINDKYTITRMNVKTDNKEKKVDIDDPDFWKKVLKDEETPGKLLLKEFGQLKENNDFMDEDSQYEFFLKLNEQIYKYVEKAKTGEVNYEEEEMYNKILQQVVDDPFVREDLKIVSTQLMSDIRKKPRRLKKRDVTGRKRTTKRSKKSKVEDVEEIEKKLKKGKEEEEFVIDDNTTKSIKRREKKKRGKALGKRQKMEEEGLYKNSDSETSDLGPKRKKRKGKEKKKGKTSKQVTGKGVLKPNRTTKEKILTKVKSTEKSVNMNADICIFCKDQKPLNISSNPNSLEIEGSNPNIENVVKCSPCKRTFHPHCLEAHIQKIVQSSNIEPSIALQKIMNDPNILIYNAEKKICLNCTVDLVDCFVCKIIGKVKVKVDVRMQKNVREAILNSTRLMQRDEPSAFDYEELGNNPKFYKNKLNL